MTYKNKVSDASSQPCTLSGWFVEGGLGVKASYGSSPSCKVVVEQSQKSVGCYSNCVRQTTEFLPSESFWSTILCVHTSGACAPGSLRLCFESSRKNWTFCSRSLLCQRFARRREETAWKRRRMETCLVSVMVMLGVLTYVVFYKLFGNWIGVVWSVSQEV